MKPLNVRFQEYYNENYQMVHRTVFSIVKDRAAADDVTSEVFICLYQYLLCRKNPPAQRIRPWLFVTAKSRACNYLRGSRPVLTEQTPEAGNFPDTEPGSRLFSSEMLDDLYRKSPQWFDAVEKYYYLELSAAEIAREYRCSPGAVLGILARARKYLREELGEDFRG